MRTITKKSCYGHNLHVVELEHHEVSYPDERLITMADRHGELSDADWQAILDGKHPCHFGGTVEHSVGRLTGVPCATIKVYID